MHTQEKNTDRICLQTSLTSEFLSSKDFSRVRKSSANLRATTRHVDDAIEVIGNFPLKRNHFISVSQRKGFAAFRPFCHEKSHV